MTEHENVRMAVVAFNVILGCDDLEAAKQIAASTLKAFRENTLPNVVEVETKP